MTLEIRHLSFRAEGRMILDDMNLLLHNGLTVITGESGAGKSTLLSLIAGLEDASSGNVSLKDGTGRIVGVLDARDGTAEEKAAFRRDHLAFILQENNLLENVNVYENVQTAAAVRRTILKPGDVYEALEKGGLPDFAGRSPETMSGGEKQRASLVRAVLLAPEILLADEPTGSLDSVRAEEMFRMLKAMSAERIVLVVTHSMELAERFGDRLMILRDGRIISDREIAAPRTDVSGKRQAVLCRTGPSGDPPVTEELPGSPKKPEKADYRTAGRLLKRTARFLTGIHIRRFRNKFIVLGGLLALSLAAAGSIHAVMYEETRRTEDMNGVYYSADEIDIYPENPSVFSPEVIVTGGEGGVFREEDVETVRSIPAFREVIPSNQRELYLKGTYTEVSCKPIAIDAFFRDRIMREGIEGRFPEKDSEMILGEDAAAAQGRQIRPGDLVIFEDDAHHELALTVSGINHRRDVDGVFKTYIPWENLLALGGSEETALFLASRLEDPGREVYAEDADGIIAPAGEARILAGREPEEEGEVALSCGMAFDLCRILAGSAETVDTEAQNFLEDTGTEEVSAVPPEEPEKLLEFLSGEMIYLRCSGARKAYITGIHDGETERILVSSAWHEEMTRGKANVLECYARDMKTAADFDGAGLPEGCSFISNYGTRFGEAVESGQRWKRIVVCVVIFTCILAFGLLRSFLRITLAERRHETGLLAAMGADSCTLRRILEEDGLVFAAISSTAGMAGYLLVRLLMRTLFQMRGPGIFTTMGILLAMPAVCFLAARMGRRGIRSLLAETPAALLKGRI